MMFLGGGIKVSSAVGLSYRKNPFTRPRYVLAFTLCISLLICSHLPVLPGCDALHDYVTLQHSMHLQLARMNTALCSDWR